MWIVKKFIEAVFFDWVRASFSEMTNAFLWRALLIFLLSFVSVSICLCLGAAF